MLTCTDEQDLSCNPPDNTDRKNGPLYKTPKADPYIRVDRWYFFSGGDPNWYFLFGGDPLVLFIGGDPLGEGYRGVAPQ